MKSFIITLISLCIIITNYGQVCTLGQYVINDNGNSELQSIEHASNGDVVIAGLTTSSGAGQEDVFVTRIDNQNNILWSKTYGTSSEEIGYPIYIKTTPNGFLIATSSFNYVPSNRVLVLLNIDNNGNILWQKRMNNVSGYSDSRTINIDNQGNYLISGTKAFNSQGLDDVYIMKLDNLGNLLWSYSYGTDMTDHSFSIVQTNDNGYISVGISSKFGTGAYAKLLIKLDQNGVFQWSKYYDNDNFDNINDVLLSSDNYLYTIGIEGNSGSFDGSLTKFSESGSIVWSKTYGGTGNDNPCSLESDSQGNIYISGYSTSYGNGSNDVFLSKIDNNGNEIWTKFYGGISNETIYGIAKNMSLDETNNKIFLFGNSTSFGSNNSDPYLIITDLDGNSECNLTDVNWTVNTTNPTSGNAPGISGTIGILVNANFTSNDFNFNLDTLCTSICDNTGQPLDIPFISPINDICVISLPTGFSPNADGLNDELFPIFPLDKINITAFRVYNRTGEIIHNSISPWNGIYKGKELELGVYVYYVEYLCNSETKKLIGNVSIVR